MGEMQRLSANEQQKLRCLNRAAGERGGFITPALNGSNQRMRYFCAGQGSLSRRVLKEYAR
jgi:hypothetical protein